MNRCYSVRYNAKGNRAYYKIEKFEYSGADNCSSLLTFLVPGYFESKMQHKTEINDQLKNFLLALHFTALAVVKHSSSHFHEGLLKQTTFSQKEQVFTK